MRQKEKRADSQPGNTAARSIANDSDVQGPADHLRPGTFGQIFVVKSVV
jgi:hypothetical protein